MRPSRRGALPPASASDIPLALLLAVLLLALAGAAACSKPGRSAEITVERYMSAIQQRDDRIMAVLWAPYRRGISDLPEDQVEVRFAGFQEMIRQAHREFENAKETGVLAPDPLGVAMFRALRLGKGAISIPMGLALEENGRTATVHTRLVTNLDNLQADSLPFGVRVFLMGYPFGRLETVAVGYEKLEDHSLLGSVDITWSLSRETEEMAAPAGWLIESITVDPDTAARWQPGRRGN
jgi:hypothetical protein